MPLPRFVPSDAHENVLDAAKRRVAHVFDCFDRVVVSISGGKDSLVLWHLAVSEAERRGRRVEVFFLDQEAEYQGTIDVISRCMRHPAVEPLWYQVPLRMTNATSHRQIWMNAWGPGEAWMREKDPIAIHEEASAPNRFYDFFPWVERSAHRTAFLVGLRARESLNRWRASKANPGFQGLGWSTVAAGDGNFRFYPLFDWWTWDVWKCISDAGLRYNPVYDRMFALGYPERKMRVSFLVHEQSFKAMTRLQEIEPDTFERLIRRLRGAHTAALYAEEPIFGALKLPSAFASWREYRDHLTATTPLEQMPRMLKRFAKQGNDEAVCREHVRQLLANDWENNVPIKRRSAEKLRELWWDRL
jgi:predicted phosphoadenosine phosphosulfate sulfurtransferase